MSVVDEWVQKAEADYQSAIDLNRRRRDPVPDVVCYHRQQAAERYLKACLEAQGIRPPAVHDLDALLVLCSRGSPALARLDREMLLLNPFGVLIRYPGLTASQADAREAVVAARHVRAALRAQLGI